MNTHKKATAKSNLELNLLELIELKLCVQKQLEEIKSITTLSNTLIYPKSVKRLEMLLDMIKDSIKTYE